LLQHVRIVPAVGACEAALAQDGVRYLGNHVPRLPLTECTSKACECSYVPVGTMKVRPLRRGSNVRAKQM
jgi:hypothetical protein